MSMLGTKEYEALLDPLQRELGDAARWIAETGRRLVILFEGRDTAGKGSAIATVARHLNPRQCSVVALAAPTGREQGQWYFQRYVAHLPPSGGIALFDRSWYNRAGVERVMGFCTEEQSEAFLRSVPAFERELVADGVLLFKYWLCCDQDRQEERFAERLNNPMKRWKLSPIDREARSRYAAYTDARDRMLEATHTAEAPWTLIESNDQALGRLTLLRDLLDRLPDTKLPVPEVEWSRLPHPPMRESYRVLEPIKPYPIGRH